MFSALISTLLVGLVGSVISIVLGVIPYNPLLFLVIVVSGAVQGLLGGYFSSVIWKRYFRKAGFL